MRSDYDKEIQDQLMNDEGMAPLGKAAKYSLPLTILTYVSQAATLLIVLLILFAQTNSFNIFGYYQIRFPYSNLFYLTQIINIIVLLCINRKWDIPNLARWLKNLGWAMIFFYTVALIDFMVFECWKYKFAPGFYYGCKGTSDCVDVAGSYSGKFTKSIICILLTFGNGIINSILLQRLIFNSWDTLNFSSLLKKNALLSSEAMQKFENRKSKNVSIRNSLA